MLKEADATPDDGERGELAGARRWLSDLLEDGAVSVRNIRESAKSEGFAWRTVERAKKDVEAHALKAPVTGEWRWALPGGNANTANPPTPPNMADMADLEPRQHRQIGGLVPMTGEEKRALRGWLAAIEETDTETIERVVSQCEGDAKAREYYMGQVKDYGKA